MYNSMYNSMELTIEPRYHRKTINSGCFTASYSIPTAYIAIHIDFHTGFSHWNSHNFHNLSKQVQHVQFSALDFTFLIFENFHRKNFKDHKKLHNNQNVGGEEIFKNLFKIDSCFRILNKAWFILLPCRCIPYYAASYRVVLRWW